MKKSIIILVSIFMIAGFSTKLMAQVTENTDAGAKILTVLTITETSDLHFGTMGVLAAQGGTCVLSTQGVRTATAGVNLSLLAPLKRNAAYTVTGEPTYTYAITLPATITITHTNNINTMTIDNLLARTASAAVDGLVGTLDVTNGDDTFTVGGTLNVAAGQVSGVYSGNFDVTVAYN